VPFDDYFYGNAYGRTSVSFGRMSVGLDARPNSPTDNTAIRTETKIKIAALTFLWNRSCAYIHSRTHSPRSYRRNMLHHDRAAAPATQRRAIPCMSAATCLPLSTTTHHWPLSSSSQRCVVHNNCSGTSFFTAPSRLSTAILPLHCTRAFASYRSSPLGRPWLPATLCFKCFRYFKSYF
jgi:hypothetical protein